MLISGLLVGLTRFDPVEITCSSIRPVMLTRRQRNDIFERIASRGLDPASCELVDRTLGNKSQVDLAHQPTQPK